MKKLFVLLFFVFLASASTYVSGQQNIAKSTQIENRITTR